MPKFIRRLIPAAANSCKTSPLTPAIALLLCLSAWLLHRSALQGFWRVDDPLILLYVAEQPDILGYFLSPSKWQALGVPFFTPWLTLDYRLDSSLFGTEPAGHYLHHLILIWACSLLTYLLLRDFVGYLWASAAALLFLAGAPTAIVAQQLMSRHYATGLMFMLLALYLWLNSRPKGIHLWLTAGCYLAAMLNKEIYAPLPLVLLFLSKEKLKDRLAAMGPFVLAGTLYVAWRRIMLGTTIGGYAPPSLLNWVDSVTSLPETLLGPPLFSGFVFWALLLVAGHLFRRNAGILLATGIAISLPFLAIRASNEIQHLRFLFLPWWVLCVLLAVTAHRLTTYSHGPTPRIRLSYAALPLVLVIMATALLHGRAQQDEFAAIASQFDVQGRFLWAHSDDKAYIPTGEVAGAIQFQGGLSELKRWHGLPQAPKAVPTQTSAAALAGHLPLYVYDADRQLMSQPPPRKPFPQHKNQRLRHIRLDRRKGGLEWFITDHQDSQCFLLFPEMNASIMIPCSGGIAFEPLPFVRGNLQALVSWPDQRWETTPLLTFPARGELLSWSDNQR